MNKIKEKLSILCLITILFAHNYNVLSLDEPQEQNEPTEQAKTQEDLQREKELEEQEDERLRKQGVWESWKKDELGKKIKAHIKNGVRSIKSWLSKPETGVHLDLSKPKPESTPLARPEVKATEVTRSEFESITRAPAERHIDPNSLEGRRIAKEKTMQENVDAAEKQATEREINQRKATERFAQEATPILNSIEILTQRSDPKEMLKILKLDDPAKSYTISDVKEAYHKEALRWHPDKWSDATPEIQKQAAEIFKQIKNAYDFLKDPKHLDSAQKNETPTSKKEPKTKQTETAQKTRQRSEPDRATAQKQAKQAEYQHDKKIGQEINEKFGLKKITSETLMHFTKDETEQLKNLSYELLRLDPAKSYTPMEITQARARVQEYYDNQKISDNDLKNSLTNSSNFLIEESLQAEELENGRKIIEKATSLHKLDPELVKALRPITISRLTDVQITQLLRTPQIEHLSLKQIDAFSEHQIEHFSDDKIKQLEKRFVSLKPKPDIADAFYKKLRARKAAQK